MKFKTHLAFICSISILLFSSCTSKDANNFSVSGKVTGLNNNYIVLSKVDDIQKKTKQLLIL